MSNLYYLAHLVEVKNGINRRRRRFYNLMNPGTEHIKLRDDDARAIKYREEYKLKHPDFAYDFPVHHVYPKTMHPAYSLMDAKAGYLQAQQEMKSMTAYMRRIRTELGASFIWGDSGNIIAIKHEGKTYWARSLITKRCSYNHIDLEVHAGPSDIAMLAAHYKFETTVLT